MADKEEFEEQFQCAVCGALINRSTGETTIEPGTNAESIDMLRKKNHELQLSLEKARVTIEKQLDRIKQFEGVIPQEDKEDDDGLEGYAKSIFG